MVICTFLCRDFATTLPELFVLCVRISKLTRGDQPNANLHRFTRLSEPMFWQGGTQPHSEERARERTCEHDNPDDSSIHRSASDFLGCACFVPEAGQNIHLPLSKTKQARASKWLGVLVYDRFFVRSALTVNQRVRSSSLGRLSLAEA